MFRFGGRYRDMKVRGDKPKREREPSGALIQRFLGDSRWVESYGITAEEMESLSSAVMMGELHSERDLLFILNEVRRARMRW